MDEAMELGIPGVYKQRRSAAWDGKEPPSRTNTSGSSLASSDSSGQTSPEHNLSVGTEETSASADEIAALAEKAKKTGRSKSLTKNMLKLFKSGKTTEKPDKNATQTLPHPSKQPEKPKRYICDSPDSITSRSPIRSPLGSPMKRYICDSPDSVSSRSPIRSPLNSPMKRNSKNLSDSPDSASSKSSLRSPLNSPMKRNSKNLSDSSDFTSSKSSLRSPVNSRMKGHVRLSDSLDSLSSRSPIRSPVNSPIKRNSNNLSDTPVSLSRKSSLRSPPNSHMTPRVRLSDSLDSLSSRSLSSRSLSSRSPIRSPVNSPLSSPMRKPPRRGGAWRAGDSNLSNEDLLKILQEFKETGVTQDDVFKRVQRREDEVKSLQYDLQQSIKSPQKSKKAGSSPEKRVGPLHHEYDEPPENYATSIEELTTDGLSLSDGGAPSSPPSLMRAVSDDTPSLTPSLSASLSDDRSDIGSAPSSSPLRRIQKIGFSLRSNFTTKMSPSAKRKNYKVSRSQSTPAAPNEIVEISGPLDSDPIPTSHVVSSSEHSFHSAYEPSSDGKSTISSTNSDFSTTISTPSESCDTVCDIVRPVPVDMFNEYGEYIGHYCNIAIANKDQMSLYNKEELQLKKGDLVYITNRSSEDGRWECVSNGYLGKVKFVYLNVLSKSEITKLQKKMRPGSLTIEGVEALLKLSSLKELLQRIGCDQYWSILQLHQITTLDDFKHLEKQQLDDLQIKDDTHRIELLTAAKVLRDPKSDEVTASRLSQASHQSTSTSIAEHPLSRFSLEQRDSGFYNAEGNGSHRKPLDSEETRSSSRSSQEAISEENELNNENYNNSNGFLRNGHYGMRGSPVHLDQGRRASPVPTGRGSPCPTGQQGMRASPVPQEGALSQDRRGSPVPTEQRQQQIQYQPIYHRHERRDVVQALQWTSYPSCPYPHHRGQDLGAVDMLSAHGGTNGVFRPPPARHNYSFDESDTGVHSDPGVGVEMLSQLSLYRPPAPPQRSFFTHDLMVSQQRRPSEPLPVTDDMDYWRRSSLTDVYGGKTCDTTTNSTQQKTLCPTHARGAAQRRHRKSRSVSPHKRHHHHHHHREVAKVMPNVHCMPTLPLRGGREKGDRCADRALSLDIVIEKKLEQEGIDLTSAPYSDKMGFCGVPPALVQRYAEEIEAQVPEVAQCMEAIRVKHLVEACRCWFKSDTLAHQSQQQVYAGLGETVSDWLISLGLPMYIKVFITQGWDALEIVIAMEEDDLRKCGISNSKHLRRLMTAVEHLKMSWRT